MNIFLKNCLIADTQSPYYNQKKNILIHDGIVSAISNEEYEAEEIIDEEDLIISPGWVDIFSFLGEPGFEFKETLFSGTRAAAAGGFTHVFCLPNTLPVIDSRTQAAFISAYQQNGVKLHPLGAVSKNTEGKQLAEMHDLFESGAIAFSDGLHPVQSSGFLLKALQYIKGFGGIIIQLPVDQSISAHGLMNEGIVSTKLGMPGIPALGEEIFIQRDIELLGYTESRLHITGVSTQKGISLIKKAKQSGLNITCSIAPYHLIYCDEDLEQFDTYLKVSPPLRSRNDMMALRKGVEDGTVDCIASHHLPQDKDAKQCEFEKAGNGMTGLQTCFSSVLSVLPELNEKRIVELFSTNARSIFNLPSVIIKPGQQADFTLFSLSKKFTLTENNNKSRSVNSPFFNVPQKGKVAGIIHNNHLNKN